MKWDRIHRLRGICDSITGKMLIFWSSSGCFPRRELSRVGFSGQLYVQSCVMYIVFWRWNQSFSQHTEKGCGERGGKSRTDKWSDEHWQWRRETEKAKFSISYRNFSWFRKSHFHIQQWGIKRVIKHHIGRSPASVFEHPLGSWFLHEKHHWRNRTYFANLIIIMLKILLGVARKYCSNSCLIHPLILKRELSSARIFENNQKLFN